MGLTDAHLKTADTSHLKTLRTVAALDRICSVRSILSPADASSTPRTSRGISWDT